MIEEASFFKGGDSGSIEPDVAANDSSESVSVFAGSVFDMTSAPPFIAPGCSAL